MARAASADALHEAELECLVNRCRAAQRSASPATRMAVAEAEVVAATDEHGRATVSEARTARRALARHRRATARMLVLRMAQHRVRGTHEWRQAVICMLSLTQEGGDGIRRTSINPRRTRLGGSAHEYEERLRS